MLRLCRGKEQRGRRPWVDACKEREERRVGAELSMGLVAIGGALLGQQEPSGVWK